MSDIKRKAIIGSVFLFVMGVTLVGVTGFTTPVPGEWDGAGTDLAAACEGKNTGRDLFLNARPEQACPQATEEVAPAPPQQAPAPSEEKKDSFAAVAEDEWAYRAIKDVAADELPALEAELDGKKAVTRYELAVILARVMEKLHGAGKVIEGPLEKVALLEKLHGEFRTELDMLGVKQSRFTARLGTLEKKVSTLGSSLSELKRKGEKLAMANEAAREKALATSSSVEQLEKKVADFDSKLVTSEKRLAKLSEIMSRLLVKVALNDSRLKNGAPTANTSDRREFGTMARAISGLQKKVAAMERSEKTAGQRVDSLSRTIERVAAQKDRTNPGTVSSTGVDETRVKVLTQLVGRLRQRVETTQQDVQRLEKNSGTRPKISTKALAEVKGLLKDFFNTYERRLKRVERRAL